MRDNLRQIAAAQIWSCRKQAEFCPDNKNNAAPTLAEKCSRSQRAASFFILLYYTIYCHVRRLSAEKSGQGFAHDASDDSDNHSFDETLHADEGDDECKWVRDTQRIHQVLYIICVVEDQADITHE